MRIEGSDARVEDGAVRFKVPHRRPGHPFVVRAETLSGRRARDAVRRRRRQRPPGRRRRRRGRRRGVEQRRAPGASRAGPALEQRAAPPPRRRATRPTGDAADKATEKLELPRTEPLDKTPAAGGRAGDHPGAEVGGAPPPFGVDPRQRARRDARDAGARRRRVAERGARGAGRRRCAPRAGDLQEPRAEDRAGRGERGLRDRPDPERARAVRGGGGGLAALPLRLSERHPARRGGRVDHRDAGEGRRDRRRADGGDRLPAPAARTASGAARSRAWPAISTARAATAGTRSARTRWRCRRRARATSPRPRASTARPAWSGSATAAASTRVRSYLRAYPDGRFKRQATELVEQATSKTQATSGRMRWIDRVRAWRCRSRRAARPSCSTRHGRRRRRAAAASTAGPAVVHAGRPLRLFDRRSQPEVIVALDRSSGMSTPASATAPCSPPRATRSTSSRRATRRSSASATWSFPARATSAAGAAGHRCAGDAQPPVTPTSRPSASRCTPATRIQRRLP